MSDKTNTGDSARNQEKPSVYVGTPLIIPEPPLQVLPTMARCIGLENAIVYQQLYYLLRFEGNGRTINGRKWIYNTYEDWQKIFPFWSERTLRRIFNSLEEMFLVESCQPEGRASRRKYYRLNEGMLERAKTGKFLRPEDPEAANLAGSKRPEVALPYTKTSSKKTLSKESPSHEGALEIASVWKPDERTKEEMRKALPIPRSFPSEREFDAFIENEMLDELGCKRTDLYLRLCRDKWHKWNGRKWVKIYNWRQYLRGLNTHMEECTKSHHHEVTDW